MKGIIPVKTSLMIFLLLIVLIAPNGRVTDPTAKSDVHQGSIVKISGITRDAAVEIAKVNASKTHKSLQDFDNVACEEVLFWRIIFDGSGIEYVIDKKSGRIIKIDQISHGPSGGPLRGRGKSYFVKGIDQSDALKIAKRNLRAWYVREEDAEWFVVSACELAEVWRVVFDIRLTLQPGQSEPAIPSSATWQYAIDKRTGEILQKKKS